MEEEVDHEIIRLLQFSGSTGIVEERNEKIEWEEESRRAEQENDAYQGTVQS